MIDRALGTVLYACLALTLALVAGLTFALLRRRISKERGGGSAWLSIGWCAVMLVIASGLFWIGYVPFLDAAVAPADAFEVHATSQDGSWWFAYPSGKVSANRLVVPRWRPVRLVMSSKDNLHNLYLPRFGLIQTAIPGRYTSIWFQANELKTMPIQCATDCPVGRTASLGTVSIIEPEQFDQWLMENDKRHVTSPKNGGMP